MLVSDASVGRRPPAQPGSIHRRQMSPSTVSQRVGGAATVESLRQPITGRGLPRIPRMFGLSSPPFSIRSLSFSTVPNWRVRGLEGFWTFWQ